MQIVRVIAGIPEWNAVFELENGICAMSAADPGEKTQFADNPQVFLRHGYFEEGGGLSAETVRRAQETLERCLADKDELESCPMHGDRRMIRRMLGLGERRK